MVRSRIAEIGAEANSVSDAIDTLVKQTTAQHADAKSASSGNPGNSRAEQRLLSIISAHSSSLAELLTSSFDSEMKRTRLIDSAVEVAEASLESRQRQLRETCELRSQLDTIRREYDSELVTEFQGLLDLALTAESLEGELVRERRTQTRSDRRRADSSALSTKAVVVPIRESTIQLQEQVVGLRQELAESEQGFEKELASLQQRLAKLKSNKVRAKSNFQQSLKSVFKDLEILGERVDRAEGTLEKLNVHYKLDEEEVISIVSPIIDSVDHVRDRIADVTAQAEKALYNQASYA